MARALSIEVYHHDLKASGEYVEIEQLSPLRRLDKGITLMTRWSIHPVAVRSAGERQREIATLLELREK